MPGILCITDVHVCFVGDDATAVPPWKLPHKAITKVSSPKPKPAKKGGAWAGASQWAGALQIPPLSTSHLTGTTKRVLRLDFENKQHVLLAEFFAQQLEDALALIELKQES